MCEVWWPLSSAGSAVNDDELLEGFDRVYVADPFGNRLELMQPTAWSMPGVRSEGQARRRR
jgi:hypothetical protein